MMLKSIYYLSGLFSIASIVPQINAVPESAQVQSQIFRDIDRIPIIDSSSQEGNKGSFENSVQFTHVTLQHPSRPTENSLDNVSLRFELNKTTAIVGSSGSGKSRIASLLLRFYDPTEGSSIQSGSHDIKNLNLAHLRRNIAMCSQNPTMFDMSVYENIAAGVMRVQHLEELSQDKKMQAVREAAKAADALSFIEKLPVGSLS
jgi:ATP-binding cassette subfamily B (MDR/TAP) protein 1